MVTYLLSNPGIKENVGTRRTSKMLCKCRFEDIFLIPKLLKSWQSFFMIHISLNLGKHCVYTIVEEATGYFIYPALVSIFLKVSQQNISKYNDIRYNYVYSETLLPLLYIQRFSYCMYPFFVSNATMGLYFLSKLICCLH